jgi:hypothetical protein
MGSNLAKAPLVAVFYAALLYFSEVFLPLSDAYGQALYDFAPSVTWTGHLILIGYALLICAVAAVVTATVEKGGFGALVLMLPAFWGQMLVAPVFQQLFLGEPSGTLSRSDLLWRIAQGAACSLLMLVLCTLLFPRNTPASPPARGKLNLVFLPLYVVVVLPLAYFLLHFVLGYFLGWRNDAVRIFYQGGADGGVLALIINMLLDAPRYALFALAKGFLTAAFTVPLLFLMPGKRLFIIMVNVLLNLSGALFYLLPSPAMPADAALPHFIAGGAVAVLYGALAAFLLCLTHTPGTRAAPAAPAADGATGVPAPPRRTR